MIKGSIKLYTINSELLVSRTYKGKFNREKIIAAWEKRFKPKHPFLIIHILPATNISLVRENGKNMKKAQEKEVKDNSHRPPAVYDNPDHVNKYL